MTTVQSKASPAKVREFIASIPGYIAGTKPDRYGFGRKFLEGFYYDLLLEVRRAFLQKSRGGADDGGNKWKPLADSTIERRLKNRGPMDSADKARLRMFLRSLTGSERKKQQTYRELVAQRAAQRYRRKASGGVEILRDTGVLLNSISPKRPGEVPVGGIFRVRPGAIEVGSSVPYFQPHQQGGGPRKDRPPQRRIFWDRIPASVWSVLLRKANARLARMTAEYIGRL